MGLTANESNQISMAVNSYIGEQLALLRSQYFANGNLNTKHVNFMAECGYPDEPVYEDFKRAYDRIAAAKGVVDMINNGSFQTRPCVVEGDEENENKEKSPWEKKVDRFIKSQWMNIKSADMLNLIGSYSSLIVEVRDNQMDLSKPIGKVSSINDVVRLTPASEIQLVPCDWYNQKEDGLLFGKPKMYNFVSFARTDAATHQTSQPEVQFQVHASRVITLNEGAWGNGFYGVSILKSIYNNILDVQKILGSNAEGFWKNAARHIAIKYDKETSFEQIMQSYGIDTSNKKLAAEQFKKELNEKTKALSTNLDSVMYGKGTDYQILSASMTDPDSPIRAQLNQIAFAIGRSMNGMVGTQTGERSSEENLKKDAKADMERQENFISPVLTEIVNRLIEIGAIEPREFYWKWDDLLTLSLKERIENMAKLASMAKDMVAAFGVPGIEINEIREVSELLEPLEEMEEERPEA